VSSRATFIVDGEDGEGLTIQGGEVVLLPRNDLHLMGSDLSLPPIAGSDIIHPPKDVGLFTIHHGGTGRRTRMICGFLGCASAEGNPVISTLPFLLKLNVEQGGARNGSAQHSNTPRRRSPLAVQDRRPCWPSFPSCCSWRRCGVARTPCRTARPDGSLAGLREPYVARALALLHRDIARRWTVDDLGREVGLSRSALADRFIRLIGVPPMHYLANWRMQIATQKLLQHQRVPRTGCRDCRLRLRGRILPRVQEGVRHGARHVATFEQLKITRVRRSRGVAAVSAG
jgi:AraC-like DNA-binding protein